jgi:hypothetical protein
MKSGKTFAIGVLGVGGVALIYKLLHPSVITGIKLFNLTISPAEVYPNETVTISVLAINKSSSVKSATVNLGGDFMASQIVTLNPGESQTLDFMVTPSAEKTYQVSVDGLSGSFVCTAAPHADIRVESLIITPESCYVGDTVTISVMVKNYGDAPGSKTITCNIT